LVGFLVFVARSGAMPVDAGVEGVPQLGASLQRASLITGTLPLTHTSYFPLMTRYFWTAYDHWEYFNWPQTTDWQYGSVRNTTTVYEEFNYGQRVDPKDDSEVYFIAIRDDFDHVFLTGPESVVARGDFKYTVWLRRMSDSTDQLFEYGILISPVFIDAEDPDADDVYTFQIRLGYDGTWLVRKWDIRNLDSRSASTKAEGKSSKVIEAARFWNVFQIERVAGVDDYALHFRIANQSNPNSFNQVATIYVDKDQMPDAMHVGFYAAHPGLTIWKEYQYDNLWIHAEPPAAP
jgi:hypothetical protein